MSRWSGVFAAAAVAVVIVLFGPLASFIPKPALAGILLVTAAGLIDWHRLCDAVRASRYDAGLVMVTALSAIFVSVELSILIGVALSIVMFVPRAARITVNELTVGGDRLLRDRQPEIRAATAWPSLTSKASCFSARRRNWTATSPN